MIIRNYKVPTTEERLRAVRKRMNEQSENNNADDRK